MGIGAGHLRDQGDDPCPRFPDPAPKSPPSRTIFLVGDRALFAPFDPGERIVVLTAAEAEEMSRRRGPFYPFRIDLVVLDRSGHRGFAVWSESWQGGTLDLASRDGAWTAKPPAV